MEEYFSITNKTKIKLPDLSFLSMKDDILGKKYSLSLVFVGEKFSREVNKKYRDKDKSTNVLSFPFSKTAGEILLCPALVVRESKDKNKNFGKNFEELLGFLVIHGMLHLKGMSHSSRMSKAEKFYCKKYDKEYFNRNRRGHIHDQSRGGRVSKRRKKS